MSTWHRLDGSSSRYENPGRMRALWLNPQGAAFWADRAYPNINTGSIVRIAGAVRGEGELILAGWRRVVDSSHNVGAVPTHVPTDGVD